MPIAETAKLMSSLDMDTRGFDRGIGHAQKQLGFFGHTLSTALGVQLQKVVSSGISALSSGIAGGIESLAALEDATTSVDAAIAAVGDTGKITGAQVADWANAIESNIHAAFDDKAITAAAATLLRFGNVTVENLQPALVVMTDLAVKTGDIESAATTLAKALADPTKAAGKLAKQGIILTKAEQDQIAAFVKAGKIGKAQGVILDALAKKTKGAADASQGPFRKAISTFHDVIEDAQRALAIGFLPMLTRVADFLKSKLAQPQTLKMLQDFGKTMAHLFDVGLAFAMKIPWDSIAAALSIAAGAANQILNAFLKMPKWAQTAIITGAIAKIAINNIPGVGGGGGGGGDGGGGIEGKVVEGIAGGLAHAIGGEILKALPISLSKVSLLGKFTLIGEAVGLVFAVNEVRDHIATASTEQATGIQEQTARFIASQPNKADLETALAGVNQGIHDLEFNPLNVLVQGEALDRLRQMRADLETALANNGPPINPQGGAGTEPVGPFTDTQIAKAAADLKTAAADLQRAATRRDTEISAAITALVPTGKQLDDEQFAAAIASHIAAITPTFTPTVKLDASQITDLRDRTVTAFDREAAQRDSEMSSAIAALSTQLPKNSMEALVIAKTASIHEQETSAQIATLIGSTDTGLATVDSSVIQGAATTSDAARQAGLTASNGAYGAAGIISSAIAANRPITNVSVNVVATTVQKTVDVVTRYGPPGGDRDSSDRNRYG